MRCRTRIAALMAVMAAASPTGVLAQGNDAPLLAAGTVLEVSAQGKTTRVPDIATIRAGVVTQAPTAAAALADQANRMAGLVAALKRAGVADRDIATANVALSPQYKYQDGQAPQITSYQASNSASIRFRDVKRAGTILDALVGAGANQISGPDLTVDQPDAALDEARLDAMRRARARADLYARAAGLRVVRIISIDEGSTNDPRPRPPVLYRVAEKAQATEIAPGETDVSVTVNVRYLLN